MRLRGAYAIGICVITFDSRVRPHTAALSRFGEPSTARSHSRENASSPPRAALGRERAAPPHPSDAIEHGHSPHKPPIAYPTNLYLNRAPSTSMSPVSGCGKWMGKTYLPVPAISVRNFRRDRAACAGSQSKIVDESGSRHCKGVVHEVADHDMGVRTIYV